MNDILLDDNLDLVIKNGDFVIGPSTYQNQQILLLSEKGTIREWPKAGVGIQSFLLGEDPGQLFREIRQQFEQDGMKVRSLRIDPVDGKIKIDATYGDS